MYLCALKYHSLSVVSTLCPSLTFKIYSILRCSCICSKTFCSYSHTHMHTPKHTLIHIFKRTGFAGRLLLMINVLHSWLLCLNISHFHLRISVFFPVNEFLVQLGLSLSLSFFLLFSLLLSRCVCISTRLLYWLSNENKKFLDNRTISTIFWCVIFWLILFFIPLNGHSVLYIHSSYVWITFFHTSHLISI